MPNPIANRVLRRRSGEDQFTYRVRVTAGQETTPKWTFVAGAPAAVTDWGDGSARDAVTSGTEQTHAYAVAGEYTVTLVMENQAKWLSEVDINGDKVISITTPIQLFRGLLAFRGYTNSAWIQSIASWVIPSSINTSFHLAATGVLGDISGFVLPNSNAISLYSTSVTGSVANWVILSGVGIFRIYSTVLTGCPILSSMVAIQDINASNCVLPEATVDLYLSRCVAREPSTTYATPALNLGGTNAAPSNPAGLADKATLVAAGWVVTTS
jgi:hypothetical protein